MTLIQSMNEIDLSTKSLADQIFEHANAMNKMQEMAYRAGFEAGKKQGRVEQTQENSNETA